MGVYKLWDLLLTTATSKHPNELSGMILAIDASLWIVKVNTIFQDESAQIRCLFKKVLWLIQHNIKPVFVFDGTPPALKRKTLQQRRKRRRQYNDFEITKKVELQILKKIKKPEVSQDDSQSKKKQFEQKQKQIDLMLTQLLRTDQSQKPLQMQEKLNFQGKVLDKKYELFTQILPQVTKKYGNLQFFKCLDLQNKLTYLSEIQNNELPTGRQVRAAKKQMSQQQKMIYEMEIIKKKSEIRELQDNLYRKVMAKKKQNGYQIIQGIYKGKKVIQKRKIKQNNDHDSFGFYRSKKAPKNDLRQIFKSKRENQKQLQIQKNENDEDEPNDFFGKIFTKDYSNNGNNEEQSQSKFKTISEKMKLKPKKRKISYQSSSSNSGNQSEIRSRSKQKKMQKQQEQFDFMKDLGFSQENMHQIQEKQEQMELNHEDNLDNFPDFINMQELDYMNRTANNNIQFQNILQILGIPYLEAPAEAEAQCAYLQTVGIVDAVVTEDSDVFLFGARKVYRGVFQENIKYFSMDFIERKIHLTRQKMILFALMLGSDYTDGVKGIGIVNAMQILKIHQNIQGLKKFTEWARSADDFLDEELRTDNILDSGLSEKERQFYELHRKYKNYWHVHPEFPSQTVYDAYKKPHIVQKKSIKFKENRKLQIAEEIMRQKFDMSKQQIDHNMKILKKQFKRKGQQMITQFLIGEEYAKIKSKRLQKAIE